MIDSRRYKVLGDLYNKTLGEAIDSEIQIEYLKTKDPKSIARKIPVEKIHSVTKMKYVESVEITAETMIKIEEGKLREKRAFLDIIGKKLDEESGLDTTSHT